MVALRRPDELPPPPEDGLPTRPIKAHTQHKLHYWGCYLEAASTATKHIFSRGRVCVDLFAGFGVCTDRTSGERCWGSALLSLQVVSPFDLYVFNDVNPEATRVLAERARIHAGAVVFEIDLDDPDVLRRAREIREVAVASRPKVVVSTGNANVMHVVLKELSPMGKRYTCAVIDPQSAIYEWRAFEGLAYRERALDVMVLFPDAMDLQRGLPWYLRDGGGQKLDLCFGQHASETWRNVARENAHAASALRALYEEQMRKLIGLEVGRPRTVWRAGTDVPLYRLIFGSRSKRGITIWDDICRRSRDEQIELPLDGL